MRLFREEDGRWSAGKALWSLLLLTLGATLLGTVIQTETDLWLDHHRLYPPSAYYKARMRQLAAEEAATRPSSRPAESDGSPRPAGG